MKQVSSTMKKKTLIISIEAIAVALAAICVIITLTGRKPAEVDPNPSDTTDPNVSVNVPSNPDDPSILDIPDNSDNPTGNEQTPETDNPVSTDDNTITVKPDDADPNKPSDEPTIVDNTAKDDTKTDTDKPEQGEDKTTGGQKDKETVQTGPASGEDRSDILDDKKQEQAPTTEPNPEDKPVIAGDETITTDTTPKDDVVVGDEQTGSDGKNTPEYVDPATGGENPFIGGGNNGVTEIPAEDLIGEDDPKPGEGIHF